jgi:Flp pilus assembly pilin Flp
VHSFSRQTIEHQPQLRQEEGQTMAEYGVVLSVITLAVVAVFTALSGGVIGALGRVAGLLPR